ncbi:MAG: FAD-dependent oxidoreductase [Acidimicrobiia bacterium]|nr:FAD-dependent oxidoreductase [Acidimicrobiia bacterium]
MSERLVVIGGDAGGMAAASTARRRRDDLEIVALEKDTRTSYSACGIPYHVGGLVPELDDLVARTPQEFRDRQRIDVRLRSEAVGVDLADRSVEVRDHAHERTYRLGFDQLLIGTGARPVRPPLPGIDEPWVRGVQNLDDAAALLDVARDLRCEQVAVVGGGYIGLEMAEAFVQWGADVAVVEAGPQVMRTLDPDMAALVVEAMERHGVDVHVNTPVAAIERGRILTEDDDELPADLVVLGLGVTPNAELAGDAGLVLGHRGAIEVDHRQRTSAEGVWAAGDCATSFHLVRQERVHVALGTVANRQARVAGINIGGGYATFGGVVGTAMTRLCSTEIARTGVNEAEAQAAGFEYVVGRIESTTKSRYMPKSAPITVKVLAEVGTGRLLGGQIVGGEGSAKRIDTLATAITAGFDLDDMVNLDLGYCPPLSPVWDPVVQACRAAAG